VLIHLVRHGESLANTGQHDPLHQGDAFIPLSEQGQKQAYLVGAGLGREKLIHSLIYCSPYSRTRETLEMALKGANCLKEDIKVYEDPRLREVERGYTDEASQHPLRLIHGWFYYRHDGGESAADCYDRTSAFLESLMRQVERKPVRDVLIFCHGMTIRCFVMRFLHLSVEQFESIANPENGDIVTLAQRGSLQNPVFENGRWGVDGLKIRTKKEKV